MRESVLVLSTHWLHDHHKRKVKLTCTHVMTSFRDSIAFSSVILSGLSSDVCFFMSAKIEEKGLVRRRQEEIDENHVEKAEQKRTEKL